MVILVHQVHLGPLDLLDLQVPMTGLEAMMITPDITQPLKERKVIVDLQGFLKFKVTARLMFTLSGMR